MLKQNAGRSILFGTAALMILGCSPMEPVAEPDDFVIAPPGKEDNFFSNTAQEYEVTAEVPIILADSYKTKSESERTARARKIMEGRTEQIGWFLHVYLVDKSSSDGEPAKYGGLRAMVLDGDYQSDGLKADQDNTLKFVYTFKVQIGGTKELLRKLRKDQGLSSSADTFKLKLAKVANSKLVGGFSHSGYSPGKWSPDTCKCELETIDVKVAPIDASYDAYLDHGKFIEDKVLDISVHFGWDYHARYDITHSRQLYEWLTDTMGFTSPAAAYKEYNRLSGPLTKEVTINEKAVTMKVTIFRPDPCEAWDEDGSYGSWAKAVDKDEKNKKRACDDWKWSDSRANANATTNTGAGNLMADLKASMKKRDVIIFSGHSGYTYGYALASWYKTSKGDLDPPEIKKMDLPKDKSQLFVMSGCDTYHVAQAFKQNPNKLGLNNADVITTTSFSDASSVDETKDIIRALVGDSDGKVKGASYGKLLKDLNPSSYDYSWHFAMYGVHGIDDNPLANPLGDATKSCDTCERSSDCGAVGNVCVSLNSTEKVCAQECLHDKGCGPNMLCRKFGSSSTGHLKGMACVPKSLSCNVSVPPKKGGEYTASGDVARRKWENYSVDVGSSARNIVVEMTGTNDADIYTRFEGKPSSSKYDCRPYKYGSKETCKYDKSKGTTLYIGVRGYSSRTSKFSIKVTWD